MAVYNKKMNFIMLMISRNEINSVHLTHFLVLALNVLQCTTSKN